MLRVLLLITFFVLATCSRGRDILSSWESYKLHHNKHYHPTEETQRRNIWEQNMEFVMKHNSGRRGFWLGSNSYADWTKEDFAKMRCGPHKVKHSFMDEASSSSTMHMLPDHVDWRTKNWVTPIQDQGSTGSAWAYTVVEVVEAQHANATGRLVGLSTQNLVDCVSGYPGPEEMYEYIIKNKGIDTAACYPPKPQGGPCRFNRSCVGATISSYREVARGDEDALKVALATVGPVAAAIDASHASFQLYQTGVYDEPACSSTMLDHAVLIVGYGTLQGEDYWIVKNSWGVNWGMKGYILMSRNKNNQCGIASYATFPLV